MESITYKRKPFQEGVPYQFERTLDSSSNVNVKVGELVRPESILATTWYKSGFRTFNLGNLFKLPPEKLDAIIKRTVGSRVYQGDVIAQRKEFFGLRERTFKSPLTGDIVNYDKESTRLTLQYLPHEVKVVSGVFGKIVDIIPQKNIAIGTVVDAVYGIVTFGTDREGSLLEIGYPDIPLQEDQITEKAAGKIIFGGTKVSIEVLYKALAMGVKAIITGGIDYQDYLQLRSSKGRFEDVGISVVATEGFIIGPMYSAVYEKLKEAEHRHVFLHSQKNVVVLPLPNSKIASLDSINLREGRLAKHRGYGILIPGQTVRVLSGDNVGQYGVVENAEDTNIVVKIREIGVKIRKEFLEIIE
ncbi:KOW motif-containing protein [candidate division WWE3 bacterium]|uniref:KOW motif-containing protein n=1 Tax=candidate division WWE3 bacterium TaxID=2053526 RepID=A0A955LKK3_UNCKA|nr:KOW motif-containing protein [candidate division WWE3 bacterium]